MIIELTAKELDDLRHRSRMLDVEKEVIAMESFWQDMPDMDSIAGTRFDDINQLHSR